MLLSTTHLKVRRALGEGASVAIGKVTVAVASLVGVRVLTELAPPTVYGGVSLLLGVVSLGNQVFVGPVGRAQLRYDPVHSQQGLTGWFTHLISCYAWAATGLFAFLGFLIYVAWSSLSTEPFRPLLLALMLLLVGLQTARTLRTNRLNAAREQTWLFIWLGTEAWLLVLIPAAALMLLPSVESYLGGIVAATLVGVVVFGRRHQSGYDVDLDGSRDAHELYKTITRYAAPFLPLALLSWLLNIGDRYLIGGLLSSAQVGVYAAAYGLASQPFILIGSAATTLLRPMLFDASASGNREMVRKLFRLWLLAVGAIGIVGVAALTLLRGWVAHLFLAAPYRAAAASLMAWIGAGYALMVVAHTLEYGLMVQERSGRLVFPATMAASANVLLNLILLPRVGVVGAAVATTVGFAIQVGLLVLLLRGPWESVANER